VVGIKKEEGPIWRHGSGLVAAEVIEGAAGKRQLVDLGAMVSAVISCETQ
jgi:hypothetical protein